MYLYGSLRACHERASVYAYVCRCFSAAAAAGGGGGMEFGPVGGQRGYDY